MKRRMSSTHLCLADRVFLIVGSISSVATVIFYVVNGHA